MPLTIVLDEYFQVNRRIFATGRVTATGAYVTGGDTVDLSPLSVGSGIQLAPVQGASQIGMPGGYLAVSVDSALAPNDPGPLASHKIKVFYCGGASAVLTELPAAAYPAALLATAWTFAGWFRRGTAKS